MKPMTWAAVLVAAFLSLPGVALAQKNVGQPAATVPQTAVCYGAVGSPCLAVTALNPLPVTGGGGGGSSVGATAAASGTVAVTAGTNKPLAIDLFSSLPVLVKDSSGVAVDWTAPVPTTQSGTWTVGLSAGTNNIGDVDVLTLPALPTGSNVIGAVTQSGAFTFSGTGSAASPATGQVTAQGLVADDAAAGTTNPVAVGGIYRATQPTYTDLDRAQAQFDVNGNLRITPMVGTTAAAASTTNGDLLGTSGTANNPVVNSVGRLAGATAFERARSIGGSFGSGTGVAAVESAGSPYVHISTNASTNAIKSGAGILHKVCVNTKGASANVATVYDSLTATGTVIAVIDTTTANVACMNFDLAFATGLSVLTATGTAADLTVTYR